MAGPTTLAAASRNTGVLLAVPLVLLYLYGPREDRAPKGLGLGRSGRRGHSVPRGDGPGRRGRRGP